jgi:hypothetical protein
LRLTRHLMLLSPPIAYCRSPVQPLFLSPSMRTLQIVSHYVISV